MFALIVAIKIWINKLNNKHNGKKENTDKRSIKK
jgi:hypothetical protein